MSSFIELKNVIKRYRTYSNKNQQILDIISTKKQYGEDCYVLAGIDLSIDKGDCLGVVGLNGSGKTTLSNIIAEIIPPTTGEMKVVGNSSIVSLKSLLKNEMTGRQNMEYRLILMGYESKRIRELESQIIEFSELGHDIDKPVSTYSTEMKAQLDISMIINLNLDIFVIDEILSVGDQAFAQKCLDRLEKMNLSNKTIILVSHSLDQIKRICNKVLWLESGMVKYFGLVDEVMPKYESFIETYKKMSDKEKEVYRQEILDKQRDILEERQPASRIERRRAREAGTLL